MSQEAPELAISKTGLSVSAALFLFAVVLAFNPLAFENPVVSQPPAPAWATDATPVRQPLLKAEYQTGVFRFRCSECHDILPPRAPDVMRTLVQHQEITLEHGINTWCLSCHHATNRDAFVDDRGGEIPWDQPQLLCAKCHGPVYRDWQNGAHGRTNGSWDKASGKQTRRKCIECHDPHRPPFPAMRPAPGPNTLRMGEQDRQADQHATRNPLQLSGHGQPAQHDAAGAVEEAD